VRAPRGGEGRAAELSCLPRRRALSTGLPWQTVSALPRETAALTAA
jgi:hypothetical protein